MTCRYRTDEMLTILLRQRMGPYRPLIIAVVMFQAVQSLAGLYLPTINANIIDRGVATGDTGYIWRLGGVMILVTLAQVLFAIAAVWAGAHVAVGIGRDVRGALFHRVQMFSAREVGQFGAPSLITRITNDVQQVQMLVLTTCTLLLAAPFTAIGGVVLALRQDVGLSWVIVVAVPVVGVLLSIVVSKMVPTFRAMQERIDRINEILREQLTGVRVVRAFGREPEEKARFAVSNSTLTDTALRGGRLMGLMFPTVTVIVNLSSVAVVWIGADRIALGEMEIGSLVAFLTYLTQILMAVMMATFMAALWPRAAVSAERISEVLATESSIRLTENADPARDLALSADQYSLELRHVEFRFPGADAPVVSDLSFSAVTGETVAIIGSTGSGKTTLVNLIARLIDPTRGEIRVNGIDLRDIPECVLGTLYGLVPQRPYLFSGTVASNLLYGKPDATEAEMWGALEVAQAADFVRAMPGGLEARIAQGGANVSGGQRQRLSLARALIRQPHIYLFDDAFSALDLATEAAVRQRLVPLTRRAISLVVAQRVSTIRDATRIVVVEDGHVVGLGTHDELLHSCETYEEIVLSQTQASGVGS